MRFFAEGVPPSFASKRLAGSEAERRYCSVAQVLMFVRAIRRAKAESLVSTAWVNDSGIVVTPGAVPTSAGPRIGEAAAAPKLIVLAASDAECDPESTSVKRGAKGAAIANKRVQTARSRL